MQRSDSKVCILLVSFSEDYLRQLLNFEMLSTHSTCLGRQMRLRAKKWCWFVVYDDDIYSWRIHGVCKYVVRSQHHWYLRLARKSKLYFLRRGKRMNHLLGNNDSLVDGWKCRNFRIRKCTSSLRFIFESTYLANCSGAVNPVLAQIQHSASYFFVDSVTSI